MPLAKPHYRIKADGSVVAAPRVHAAAGLGSSGIPSGYEGAAAQRRLFAFRPSYSAINSLIVQSGSTLRARTRHLVRNNPYAKKARRVFISHLVGTGIVPVPQVKDAALKKTIVETWSDWTDEADADGLTDIYGLQALAAGAMFDGGECFIRFLARDPADGLTVPLQIRLLESELCPYELNTVTDGGNQIRAGIEFDKSDRRVAYWFWRTHPGEIALPYISGGYVRVPAEEVIHLFEPIRPGQIRGVPWLAAAIVRAYLFDQYEDAELERKKVAALFAGFITKEAGSAGSPLAGQDQPAAGTADTTQNAPGEEIAGLTPGMLQVLLAGEDIKFSEPADVGPNFEAFAYRAVLALCAAMDIPYANVTGDMTKANYSSLREAKLDLRRSLEQIQHTVMAFQLCRGIWRRWMADAVLAGVLPVKPAAFNRAPRDFLRVKWSPPRMEWVDPYKDVNAEKIAVRAGFKSREDVVASLGEDIEQIDDAIARDNARADRLGLTFDSDARKVSDAGVTQGRAGGDPLLPSPDAPGNEEQQSEEEAA